MPNMARWVRCAPQLGHVGCCAKRASASLVWVMCPLCTAGTTADERHCRCEAGNPSVLLDMVGSEGRGTNERTHRDTETVRPIFQGAGVRRAQAPQPGAQG